MSEQGDTGIGIPFDSVEIHEVGPRDGFQMVHEWIPTSLKKDFIDRLFATGVSAMQFTSFVSPAAVPQLRDAAEIAAHVLEHHPTRKASALVPNLRGARDARSAGLRYIDMVISVSEEHNRANVGMDHRSSWDQLHAIQDELPDCRLRVDLATLFSCPFSGTTSLAATTDFVGRVRESGILRAALSDTMGTADPEQTLQYLDSIRRDFPDMEFVLHFHDTFGMALLNCFLAARLGYRRFETSVAGLGGCPFAPGATGNLATEDLVHMFESVGVSTGVDNDALLEVARAVVEKVEGRSGGRLVRQYIGRQT